MIDVHESAQEGSGATLGRLPNQRDKGKVFPVDVITVLHELERGTITVDEAMVLLDDVE